MTNLRTPAVWIDREHDEAHASDGYSRFGAYLDDRLHLLQEEAEEGSARGVLATVLRIAQSPVMAPGYLRTRSDVEDPIAFDTDDMEHWHWRLRLRLPLVDPTRDLQSSAFAEWQTWWPAREGGVAWPGDSRRPMLLPVLDVRDPDVGGVDVDAGVLVDAVKSGDRRRIVDAARRSLEPIATHLDAVVRNLTGRLLFEPPEVPWDVQAAVAAARRR